MEPYRVNVSSVQDFMQCRFRWWCKWVKNRVPVVTSPALDGGKLLHTIFEDHFNGMDMVESARARCAAFRESIPDAHPAAQPNAVKAVQIIEDLTEAFPLWKDAFKYDEVLEVEQPFEMARTLVDWRGNSHPVLFLGRPDRVVRTGSFAWHVQNRGLAAGMNFGTYLRLAERHYHEHLYAEAITEKYPHLTYKGVIFNLIRKLKFRTNVGKKNEATKTAEEMFWQRPMSVNVKSKKHKLVMLALEQHVLEMLRTIYLWEHHDVIPAPNEKMNGGFSGNSEDPYFRVLIGETSLDDEDVFKDREDTYQVVQSEE